MGRKKKDVDAAFFADFEEQDDNGGEVKEPAAAEEKAPGEFAPCHTCWGPN
jgi:hypothetical protein